MSGDPLDPASSLQSDSQSNRDLLASSVYAPLAALVLVFGDGLPPAVRVPLALPLLLFVPGYVVVTALLPASRPSVRSGGEAPGGPQSRVDADESAPDRYGPLGNHEGLSILERCTLAVVTSLAVVPVITLVANAVIGVSLVPVLVGVVVVTVLGSVLAATRRAAVRSKPGAGGSTGSGWTAPAPSALLPADALTMAAVVIAVLLVGTSAAVAFSGAAQPDATTELYVGTETGGEFLAEEYPESLVPGESETVDVGVEHGADEDREYVLVASLDRVDPADPDGTASTAELDRVETTVGADERSVETLAVGIDEDDPDVAALLSQAGVDDDSEDDVAPDATDDLRLSVLLYEVDAPNDPDHEDADRIVSLPVDVEGEDE